MHVICQETDWDRAEREVEEAKRHGLASEQNAAEAADKMRRSAELREKAEKLAREKEEAEKEIRRLNEQVGRLGFGTMP